MITARWCGLLGLAMAMMAGCSTTNVYETVGTGDAASDGATSVDSSAPADGTTTGGGDGGEAGDGGDGPAVDEDSGAAFDASAPDTYTAPQDSGTVVVDSSTPDTYSPPQDSGAVVDSSNNDCINVGSCGATTSSLWYCADNVPPTVPPGDFCSVYGALEWCCRPPSCVDQQVTCSASFGVGDTWTCPNGVTASVSSKCVCQSGGSCNVGSIWCCPP
jgi:hypothetical protein